MSRDELRVASDILIESYPDDIDDSILDELCQFAEFFAIFSDEEPEDISTELYLYQLIKEKGVEDTFPSIEVALRIYLVLMVSNCSGERSFSKLKLIQNRLRTTMKQSRLVNLTIMSIESDILRELDFANVIDTFASLKARKVVL